VVLGVVGVLGGTSATEAGVGRRTDVLNRLGGLGEDHGSPLGQVQRHAQRRGGTGVIDRSRHARQPIRYIKSLLLPRQYALTLCSDRTELSTSGADEAVGAERSGPKAEPH
jgi:hypothetical protein